MSPKNTEHELQLQVVESGPSSAARVTDEATQLDQTYFEVTVNLFPVEVPDEKLLYHLEEAGCFDYLAESGENIYSLEDGEPL